MRCWVVEGFGQVRLVVDNDEVILRVVEDGAVQVSAGAELGAMAVRELILDLYEALQMATADHRGHHAGYAGYCDRCGGADPVAVGGTGDSTCVCATVDGLRCFPYQPSSNLIEDEIPF